MSAPGVSRFARFWHEPLRAERLAIARILFAAALLTDQVFQYGPHLAYFYGPEGVAPAGLNDGYLVSTWRWAILLFNTDDMTIVTTVFGLWLSTTALWLVGWHTRVMGFLVWLLTMAFLARNPNLKNGGDDVLQIALFMLMISPCGAALSLDRKRSLRRKGLEAPDASTYIAPWPVRLFQLQLCVMYLTTGIAKLAGDTWWNGTSVHYVLNDITMARWSYAQLPLPLWFTAILTYSSVWFEVLFTPLVLWQRTRKWTLWFGVAFHLGIYLMIEVGWFSFYTIAMYGVWIPDAWWRRYFGPGRKHDGPIEEPENTEPGPHDYLVYFDTLCPICRKSRATLQRLDWGGRLIFRDIHDRERMEQEVPGVPYARALKEIIVATPGWSMRNGNRANGFAARLRRFFVGPKVLGGFEALRRTAWALPALWVLLPFLYFPLVPTVARFVYRAVARNRYRLAACNDGTCELHLRALSKANLDEDEIRRIVTQARAAQTQHPH
jgi:predicted DCC family thiol-disulfide oxidoreductase YuxK